MSSLQDMRQHAEAPCTDWLQSILRILTGADIYQLILLVNRDGHVISHIPLIIAHKKLIVRAATLINLL